MPLYDYVCDCGKVFESWNTVANCDTSTCECGAAAKIAWLPRHQFRTAFDASETTVVYMNAQGEVNYPGRNDVPVPDRLRKQGFERVELRSLREVERFESKHGVRNERAWFDKGSGRSFDNNGRDGNLGG